MRDLNQMIPGVSPTNDLKTGWQWVDFWVDSAKYWESRQDELGDGAYQVTIDRSWELAEMELIGLRNPRTW